MVPIKLPDLSRSAVMKIKNEFMYIQAMTTVIYYLQLSLLVIALLII